MQDGGDFPKPTHKDIKTPNGVTEWHKGNSAKQESYKDKVNRKKAELADKYPKPDQNQPQPESDEMEEYGPDSERYGWPKNWKAIFKRDSSKWLGKIDAIHQDPQHLFSIHPSSEEYLAHIHEGDKLFASADRVYWRYTTEPESFGGDSEEDSDYREYVVSEGHLTNFQPAVYLSTNVWEFDAWDLRRQEEVRKTGSKLEITAYSDTLTANPRDDLNMSLDKRSYTKLSLINDGDDDHRHVVVNQALGRRHIDFNFDTVGTLSSFGFGAYGGKNRGTHLTGVFDGHQGKWTNLSEGISVEDINVEGETGGLWKITRLDGGEVVDEFVINKKVNIDDIQDLFPDELIRNPQNPNPDLDIHWKTANIKSLTGLHWTPAANDRFNTLAPIPEPASEDQ